MQEMIWEDQGRSLARTKLAMRKGKVSVSDAGIMVEINHILSPVSGILHNY